VKKTLKHKTMLSGRYIFITGAGLSAESGIPTFRDPGATWEKFDPRKLANLDTIDIYRNDVLKFYNDRRVDLVKFHPNPAHIALAELQKKLGTERVIIFTQNGDDLLDRAGAKEVHYLHGRLTDMHCQKCDKRWPIGYTAVTQEATCPFCTSSKIKPGVVFFNEIAPLYELLDKTIKEARAPDKLIIIGTKGEVLPFKRLVGNRHHPRRPRTYLINLHREQTIPYTRYFDQAMFAPASTAVPQLLNEIST
jgi:NAD-dependent deacetylase